MRKILFFICLPLTIFSAETQTAQQAATTPSKIRTIMSIDPKARALDYAQAFEMLRKEKTSNKVVFQLADGSTLSNVIEMTVIGNGTLILFKVSSNTQGIRLQVVEVEKILAISHL
jgi:hypothetical protein